MQHVIQCQAQQNATLLAEETERMFNFSVNNESRPAAGASVIIPLPAALRGFVTYADRSLPRRGTTTAEILRPMAFELASERGIRRTLSCRGLRLQESVHHPRRIPQG